MYHNPQLKDDIRTNLEVCTCTASWTKVVMKQTYFCADILGAEMPDELAQKRKARVRPLNALVVGRQYDGYLNISFSFFSLGAQASGIG